MNPFVDFLNSFKCPDVINTSKIYDLQADTIFFVKVRSLFVIDTTSFMLNQSVNEYFLIDLAKPRRRYFADFRAGSENDFALIFNLAFEAFAH